MSDQLDLLLESVREPEPFDEAFVASVMAEVERTPVRRQARRGLRRPMVMGIAAGIVVTGGAVAAVVGTNPSADRTEPTHAPATAIVTAEEPGEASSAPSARATQAAAAGGRPPARTKTPTGTGYASDHSSFTVDEKTGLLLQTDAYTNTFTVGEAQRVTLTVENTGEYPIAVSGTEGCPLQVMAYGAEDGGITQPDASLLTDPDGRFEWVCAGSDDDPRDPTAGDAWVLAPGERIKADGIVVLPQAGEWTINGMCRCSYKQVKPTPVPRSDPLSQTVSGPLVDLGTKAVPSPLLPEQPDGRNLVTPAIGIRAE